LSPESRPGSEYDFLSGICAPFEGLCPVEKAGHHWPGYQDEQDLFRKARVTGGN